MAFPQPYLAGDVALVYFVNVIHHPFLKQLDVGLFAGQRGKEQRKEMGRFTKSALIIPKIH